MGERAEKGPVLPTFHQFRVGPGRGRTGMGCWVRTAAEGAAVRTPSDRHGEVSRLPGTHGEPERFREAVRAAGAGQPVVGTLTRPAPPVTHPPSARGRMRWPWRTLLAAVGGLVLVLAFPGYDLVWLAPLGPAALSLAVRGQRLRSGVWLGLVFGLAFFVPLLSWTGIYVGPLPWLALAVWEALHLALLGGAAALVSGLRLWPLWAAALWVADEALRGRGLLGGFPWGRLGS